MKVEAADVKKQTRNQSNENFVEKNQEVYPIGLVIFRLSKTQSAELRRASYNRRKQVCCF